MEGSSLRRVVLVQVMRMLTDDTRWKKTDPKEFSECFMRVPEFAVEVVGELDKARRKAVEELFFLPAEPPQSPPPRRSRPGYRGGIRGGRIGHHW